MKLSDSLIHLTLPDTYRIIAISDVHANAPALKRVLEKVVFDKGDILIFLGDMFERNPYFDETIAIAQSLRNKENVYFIRGNWECFVFSLNYHRFNKFYDKDRTLFTHWANQMGLSPICEENFEEIKTILYNTHKEFLNWTFSLPLGVETDDFVFVHAGLEDIPNWRDSEEDKVIRNWDYILGSQPTDKWVVAGHVPSSCYALSGMTALPIINRENHIVLTDGGTGITPYGQVNAFIAEKKNGKLKLSYEFADEFPVKTANQNYVPPFNLQVKTDWRDIYFDVINRGKNFTYATLKLSQRPIYIKNEYIAMKQDKPSAANCMCNLLSVQKDEELSIADDTCSGYALAKKQNGEIGWISHSILS